MLNLIENENTIQAVHEGSKFSLPNGDVVSPAYDGWTDGTFTLVVAPAITPTKEQQELARQIAYTAESDPIFFMAQRDEATIDDWKAKVAEIKARFPYPSE